MRPEPKKKEFEQLSKSLKAIGDAVKLVGTILRKLLKKQLFTAMDNPVLHDPSYI